MKVWRSISVLLSCLAVALISACSPSSLFDNGKDQQVLQTPSYRQINRNCTNLDLSSPALTTDEVRTVLKCFNAYGALDPLQQLVDKMSDAQLHSLVQVANTYLFQNPALLYELEKNFYSQRDDGTLKSSMQSLATLLKNPGFLSSFFQILDAQTPPSRAKALAIIQSFGAKLDPQTVDQAFTTTLTFTGSRAYRSLVKDLHTSVNPKHSLQDLVNTGYSVLQDSQAPHSYSLLDGLRQLTLNGDFGTALDTLIGTNEATIRANLPTYGALFPILSANDGHYFQAAQELVNALDLGLRCFDDTESALDPLMDGFEEIANVPLGQGAMYLQRTHMLRLATLQPFCTYAPGIIEAYPEFQRLAATGAMLAIEKSVRFGYLDKKPDGSRPVAEHIRNFLTDPKTLKTSPLFDEFAERGGWQDFILLFLQPGGADRDRLADTYGFFVDPNSYLGGESIKNALSDLILEAGPTKAYNFVTDVSTLIDQDGDWLTPVITGAQTSLDQSGAHPYLNFLHSVMTDAPKNAAGFQSLFAVSKLPEFNKSLQLLSTLASDGRLTEILADLVVLMHTHALEGTHALPPPSLASRIATEPRHHLCGSDLPSAPLEAQLSPDDACLQINIGQSTDSQWKLVKDCLGDRGGYSDVSAIADFLGTQKTSSGKTELEVIHDLIHDLSENLNQETYKSLADWLISSDNNGDIIRIFHGAAAALDQKVVNPVFNLLAPFSSDAAAAKQLDALEDYFAKILQSSQFPEILSELDQVLPLKPEPPTHYLKPNLALSENVVLDSSRIKRWIENKECENNPNPAIRETQIIKDYEEGVTTSGQVDKHPRFNWTMGELKEFAEPYFEKIADPAQSLDKEHSIEKAIFHFLGYFSLAPKDKPNSRQLETPDYLEQWFYDRATDQRLITAYYLGNPPESTPEVRLVSSLDRIEMVFSNADFDTLSKALEHVGIHIGFNLGKKAMAELADSWGDEPRELWPEEIQAKYRYSNPPTLQQTIDHFMAMLEWAKDAAGFPSLPRCEQTTNQTDPSDVQQEELSAHQGSCQSNRYAGSGMPSLPGCIHLPDVAAFDLRNIKRRLYNLAQVAEVLRENLPGSGSPQAGGIKVLRDLLFQLYYSTPLDSRGELDGVKNNLSLIHFLVDSGITRQFAFEFRRYERNDPALRSFFGALTSAANSPEAAKLFERLVGIDGGLNQTKDKSRTMLWYIAEKLYPYMGNSLAQGQTRTDSVYFKQSLIEGVALLEKWGLVDQALKAVNQILTENPEFVQAHLEDLFESMTKKDLSYLVAGFDQDKDAIRLKSAATDLLNQPELISDAFGIFSTIDGSNVSREAISTMQSRWNKFRESPGYQSLQFGEFTHELLSYFENTDLASPQGKSALALRNFAAQSLENRKLDELFFSLASRSDSTDQVLSTFAHYIDDGEIDNFLAFVKLSVNTPPPPLVH